MTEHSNRPSKLTGHEAVRWLRGATRALNVFLGYHPETEITYTLAKPECSWCILNGVVRFLSTTKLQPGEALEAIESQWPLVRENRRGDLVHLELQGPLASTIHCIVYASAEVRNPVTLELIKRVGTPAAPGNPPSVHRIREDIATGRRSWIHLWFTGRDSEHEVKDGTGLPWFIHGQYLYVKHDQDAIMTWTRLDLQQEHRKAGLVYLRSSHPLNADEFIAIHCEANEVRDDVLKKRAQKEGDLNEGD